MESQQFTICVLLYGDHPDLAARCLHCLLPHLEGGNVEVRLGLNAVSDATQKVVQTLVDRGIVRENNIYESSENICKYPMMRRMLYDSDNPIRSPYVMWFDDDSYILPGAGKPRPWLQLVNEHMQLGDMIGSPYTMGLRGNQHLWIKDQPWYNNKDVAKGAKVKFMAGGWWCIRAEILQRYNWPPEAIKHRGGDVMLGELFRQQDLKFHQFKAGVAINADDRGRESKAPRRGYDEDAVGTTYEPGMIQQASVPELPPRPNYLKLDV